MKNKLLFVDDHHVVRLGLQTLFQGNESYEVIGEAHDGRDAIDKAKHLLPDIVVMDISMPNLNGIEATKHIKLLLPQAKVIGFSLHGDWQRVRAMLASGASGYVLKSSHMDEITAAVEIVASSQTYLSPAIAGIVINGLFETGATSQEGCGAKLSDRERETLQLLADGKSAKEIAVIFHVSSRTIDSHRQRIMDKLGLYTIADLTKFAIRNGLTTVEA